MELTYCGVSGDEHDEWVRLTSRVVTHLRNDLNDKFSKMDFNNVFFGRGLDLRILAICVHGDVLRLIKVLLELDAGSADVGSSIDGIEVLEASFVK